MTQPSGKPEDGKPDSTARVMRQALRIDTWGLDIFRMKKRIGYVMQMLEQGELILNAQGHLIQELSSKIEKLETDAKNRAKDRTDRS